MIALVMALFASLVLTVPLSAASDRSAEVPILAWEVISRRPHDTAAFSQGLLLDPSGRLFESTGLWGESTVREVDPDTGEVLRAESLPENLFGEGLALVDDDLVQLTWRSGKAFRWDADTFERLTTYRYDGEGWGLCYDGERLVMSDGSDRLTFRDPETFEVIGSVAITIDGQPLLDLNELECVDGSVWANVWLTDTIVRIDPADGQVTGLLDLRGLLEPHPSETRTGSVLNGIAWDADAGSYLVTGKRWPEVIEIRLLDAESAAETAAAG